MPTTIFEVFVPGGQPTVTYNPRQDLRLEDRISEYLRSGHQVLSISGPTKSGKTVLVRKVLGENGIRIPGASITSGDDFWVRLGYHLGVFEDETAQLAHQETDLGATSVTGSVAAAGAEMTRDSSDTVTRGRVQSRRVPGELAASNRLRERRTPIIIDDFHYVPRDTQLAIVRGLKDLIFEGLPVILISVPHRAYDAVRVEREMTGRVVQLQIPLWTPEELERIAHDGFDALNLELDSAIVADLAEQAFGSPHLMQDFCLAIGRENGISEAPRARARLRAPDRDAFFRSRAESTSRTEFDRLARGPRTRSDRKARGLKSGGELDIYGAVLEAIAHCGPKTEITYEELRGALREILHGPDVPQLHEVTRVLEKLDEIAHGSEAGEPVVDWDVEFTTLHITDPFFAYFLRWGDR